MEKLLSFTRFSLFTIVCAACLLLVSLPKASGATTSLDLKLPRFQWQDASGGVIEHVPVNTSFYFVIDTSMELYGLNAQDSYTSPTLPSWFDGLSYFSGFNPILTIPTDPYWKITELADSDIKNSPDLAGFSPTESSNPDDSILIPWNNAPSYTPELEAISKPGNAFQPLSPGNRTNLFSYFEYFANKTGKTLVKFHKKNSTNPFYNTTYTFIVQVDAPARPPVRPSAPSSPNQTPPSSSKDAPAQPPAANAPDEISSRQLAN